MHLSWPTRGHTRKVLGHAGVNGPWPMWDSVVLGHIGEQLGGVAGSPDQGQVHRSARAGVLQAPSLHGQVHCILSHPAVGGPLATWQHQSAGSAARVEYSVHQYLARALLSRRVEARDCPWQSVSKPRQDV